MHLMLGMSSDEVLALGPEDKLKWMQADKQLFKLLTHTNHGDCVVSRKTYDLMPHTLNGRNLKPIDRQVEVKPGVILDGLGAHMRASYSSTWFLGGPLLALEALKRGYVDRCFFTKISSKAPAKSDHNPITMDLLWPEVRANFKKSFSHSFSSKKNGTTSSDVNVQVWVKR